jgi:hypothetical protein
MIHITRAQLLLLPLLLCLPGSVSAQSGSALTPGDGTPITSPVRNKPEAPASSAPASAMTRDASGRATVRAVKLTTPLRLDGRLDEVQYTDFAAVSEFFQAEPQEGAAATEKTEVWVFFDDRNVYFTARCWESDPDHAVVNEMRRDGSNIGLNDNVAWLFDTFADRRNGVLFETNALGGRLDGQSSNEENTNLDYNPVWDVKVAKFEGGWSIEAAIPFKSLRYKVDAASQVWGFNVRRRNRWKGETSYLSPAPRALGSRGLRPSIAGTLTGIETPQASRNFEVKPFVTASLTTDRTARSPFSNDLSPDAGLDVKYGVTQSLTADITINTDFAQVEADELQVNLTRFNLQFPEKREFFLENRQTFAFGGEGTDTPVMFYSRRIGLNAGRLVPIQAGGRLTGRAGKFSLGMLNIQADEEPVSGMEPTNFSVLRVRRDIFRSSSVGVLFTGRSVASAANLPTNTYGVDGTFSFLRNKLSIATYWAKTPTEIAGDHDASYRAQIEYAGDRYGWQLEHLAVGNEFNPDVGFVRRADMRRSFGQFRFSPRTKRNKFIRQSVYTGTTTYIEGDDRRLQTRELDGEFALELQSGDRFVTGYTDIHEFLPKPFVISLSPRVVLPVASYDFTNVRVGYNFGQQRLLAANVLAEHGTFYSGHRTAVSVSQGRLKITNQLSLGPTYSLNRVTLAEGSFRTLLLGMRVTHTMTPYMFASALLQYNSTSHLVSANVRLRWEYRPGSELFVVLNEQRDSTSPRFPVLSNRSLIVKVTRLLRF